MKQTETKAEIIKVIEQKAKRADPMVRKLFTSGLKYKTKKDLIRMRNKMKVSRNGMEISTF